MENFFRKFIGQEKGPAEEKPLSDEEKESLRKTKEGEKKIVGLRQHDARKFEVDESGEARVKETGGKKGDAYIRHKNGGAEESSRD